MWICPERTCLRLLFASLPNAFNLKHTTMSFLQRNCCVAFVVASTAVSLTAVFTSSMSFSSVCTEVLTLLPPSVTDQHVAFAIAPLVHTVSNCCNSRPVDEAQNVHSTDGPGILGCLQSVRQVGTVIAALFSGWDLLYRSFTLDRCCAIVPALRYHVGTLV